MTESGPLLMIGRYAVIKRREKNKSMLKNCMNTSKGEEILADDPAGRLSYAVVEMTASIAMRISMMMQTMIALKNIYLLFHQKKIYWLCQYPYDR